MDTPYVHRISLRSFAFYTYFFYCLIALNMYIKPPKKVGDCYVAMVVETGGKTKCMFDKCVACDVDDIWARFLVKCPNKETSETVQNVIGECVESLNAWTAENGIDAPVEIRGPVTEISNSEYKMLKVRVPRDGYEFVSGKSYSISLSVRDVKVCGGKVAVHWRVEDYFENKVETYVVETLENSEKQVAAENVENETSFEKCDIKQIEVNSEDLRDDETNIMVKSEIANSSSCDKCKPDLTEKDSEEMLDKTICNLHGALSRVRQEADEIETYIKRVLNQMPKRIANIQQ